VRSLRIKFDSQNFENPALQKHYANLQALALDRDTVEDVADYVVPDEEGMEKFAPLIKEFHDSVFPEGYLTGWKQAIKRKKVDSSSDTETTSESEHPKKKREKAAFDPTDPSLDWASLASSGELKKFTIVQLKDYMRQQNISYNSKMKKSDLIRLIETHHNN